jgi:DNA-binding MarR family transcriptional regulator
VSTSRRDSRPAVRAYDDVLGYLLKHAHLMLEQRTDEALQPFDVTARDLGALRVIAAGDRTSQQDVASTLGVDRTSMVALLDVLEAKEIISRRPSELDRRRNLVELTEFGREQFTRAEAAALEAETTITAQLGDAGAAQLRASLRALLNTEASPQKPGAQPSVRPPRTPGQRTQRQTSTSH